MVPYWGFLYNDFVSEAQPSRLKARLEPLEAAIYERMQELAKDSDSHAEKLSIQEACDKIHEIKIKQLGFPAVHTETDGSQRIQGSSLHLPS